MWARRESVAMFVGHLWREGDRKEWVCVCANNITLVFIPTQVLLNLIRQWLNTFLNLINSYFQACYG